MRHLGRVLQRNDLRWFLRKNVSVICEASVGPYFADSFDLDATVYINVGEYFVQYIDRYMDIVHVHFEFQFITVLVFVIVLFV